MGLGCAGMVGGCCLHWKALGKRLIWLPAMQMAGRASVELHTLIFFKEREVVADARITKVGVLKPNPCNGLCGNGGRLAGVREQLLAPVLFLACLYKLCMQRQYAWQRLDVPPVTSP